MHETHEAGMADALRLTRAGRLSEATALLQRLLRQEPAATPADSPPPQGRGLVQRLLDGLRGLRRPRPATAPPTRAPGRFEAGTYANAAGTRGYKLYIPTGAGGRPRPLVVMLHGCTQSPDDFAAGTRMNELAEEARCYVVYPEQCAKANPHRCWNWFQPDDQRRDVGEPSLIAGITREIVRRHPIDPARIYVAGLSAGGAAAAIMAEAYPDLFAAVGIHSGVAPGVARDVRSALSVMKHGPNGAAARGWTVPTILFHGDADQVVHPGNGDLLATAMLQDAERLRCELETGTSEGGLAYTRATWADAEGRIRHERWTVHGGGHAWSGGSSEGSYTEPRGPDASRALLCFLLAQRGPAAV